MYRQTVLKDLLDILIAPVDCNIQTITNRMGNKRRGTNGHLKEQDKVWKEDEYAGDECK